MNAPKWPSHHILKVLYTASSICTELMYTIFASLPTLRSQSIRIHGRKLLMSSSLLLKQCIECLLCLSLIVWEVCDCIAVLWAAAFWSCSEQYFVNLWSSSQAFSPIVSLKFIWCCRTVALIRIPLGRIHFLFYQRHETAIWLIAYQ